MGFNREAPSHRSAQCIDTGNQYSTVPMVQRKYNQGKRITQSSTPTTSCKICHSNPPNIAFIPCGHASTCENCSLKLQTCSTCNQKITDRQKIYFA